jgi:hypothetical protein
MTLNINHEFVSPIPPSSEPDEITTAHWNATHVFSGVLDVANGGTGSTSFTSASVIFANTDGTLTQDNANFNYNNTTNQLGISNLAVTSLTDTRIPFAGVGGQLVDSSSLTFNNITGLSTNRVNCDTFAVNGVDYGVQFLEVGVGSQKNVATSGLFTYDYNNFILNVPLLRINGATNNPAIDFVNGITHWLAGVHSSGGNFKISQNTSFGTNDYLQISLAGKTTLKSFGVTDLALYEDSVLKVSGNNVYAGCLISSSYDQEPAGAVYNLSPAVSGWSSKFRVQFLDNGAAGAAGDAYYQSAILNSSGSTVTQSYVWGIDNSDSDRFKLSVGTALGAINSDALIIDNSRNVYLPAYTSTRIPFFGSNGIISSSANFFWDDASRQVIVGTVDISPPGRAGVFVGDTDHCRFAVGQDNNHNLNLGWIYNATVANAYAFVESYAGNNPLCLQTSGGGVNVGGVNIPDTGVKLEIASLGAMVKSDGSFWVNGASTSAADYARFHQNASINVTVIDFNSEFWLRPNASTTMIAVTSSGVRLGGLGALDANYILQAPNSATQKFRANAYDTYSDEELKENIVNMPDVSANLRLVQPREFNFKGFWKSEYEYEPASGTTKGLIAQAFAELFPEFCTFDNQGIARSIDYGRISSVLIKGWQELDARIQQLEAA